LTIDANHPEHLADQQSDRTAGDLETLAGAYQVAIDDTRAITARICDLLADLDRIRGGIGVRLAAGRYVDADDPGTPWTTTSPIVAPRTVRTLNAAGDSLAVLIDALRACLHGQVETLHTLTSRAHTDRACDPDTCPHCTASTERAAEDGDRS
jgi:hypothetical protein